MPRVIDHDERRAQLSEAVWRVIEQDGGDGLTVRRIAEESGWSIGAIAHYFPSKDDLLLAAYRLALQRVNDRFYDDLEAHRGLRGLRAALFHNLCLTPESHLVARVWLAFLSRVTVRNDFQQLQRTDNTNWQSAMQDKMSEAITDGELSPDVDLDSEATLLAAFVDGTAMRAALDPASFPAERQLELLDGYLKGRELMPPAQSGEARREPA
jgi:AcrR family transcriptional regulator